MCYFDIVRLICGWNWLRILYDSFQLAFLLCPLCPALTDSSRFLMNSISISFKCFPYSHSIRKSNCWSSRIINLAVMLKSTFSQSLDTSHCSIWSIRNEKLHLSAQLLCVCCLFSIANGVALLIDQFAVVSFRHSTSNTTISPFNRSFNERSPKALYSTAAKN